MTTNSRDFMRQYMREYRAAGRDKGSLRNNYLDREFVGCDGEGATLGNGYHAYFMLTVGNETLETAGKQVRLSSMDCLDFISRQDPKKIYVGYFFDYDTTKILEDLAWPKLDRLIHRHKRTGVNGQIFPVDYGMYQVDYLPHKELKVRKMIEQKDDETVWSQWIVVNDVGSFFQCSFLKALEMWGVGTEEEREKIRAGKEKRAAFNIDDETIAEYNALEIRLLQELMDRFRAACVEAGYVPRKWQGPGQLAETMLRTHGVPMSKNVPLLNDEEYRGLVEFGRNAYYGGRFEVGMIGPVNVPCDQWDINSAYPHAMRYLPCLQHGGWEYYEDPAQIPSGHWDRPRGIRGERFALCEGSFTPIENYRSLWYGLPIRTATGGIVYPAAGRGWYWSFEIQSARHQTFKTDSAWVYTRLCDCQPLAFVEGVYNTRQRLGKNGPGIVLKLGLNSLYGKMVQSIGFPKYSNPIWASFITAYPRMMIQYFIHSSPECLGGNCGRDIVMVATDSVATITRRTDFEDSSELGGWSCEHHPDGMFVVQPGVYFGSSGKPTKTRGFTRTVVDTYEDEFRTVFAEMVESGDLTRGQVALPINLFVGIRYALQRRNTSLLGQWIEYGTVETPGKILSFDWTSKRGAMAINPTDYRSWIQTFPHEGSPEIETIPYSKNIGGLLDAAEDRLAFADLPDWAPMGGLHDV